MTRIRWSAFALLASVVACDGLKEALTAHVDVVASAGSQELSVQRMAEMMGTSQVPVRREVAQSIADAWVNFHLLGEAAVRGDSLSDPRMVDEAMEPALIAIKQQKYYEQLKTNWVTDTTNLEAKYATGELLAARHILFPVPPDQQATGSDSMLKKAEGVLARTTAANFAALAKQYGSDGTKDQGGDLGVFAPGQMVPEFAKGVAALKPGEIGPLIRTQFGYHIVRRSTYGEVADAFKQQWIQRQGFVAESSYMANLEQGARITVEPTAARTMKAVAQDPAAHVRDGTTIAKSRLGNYKAGQFAKWLQAVPGGDQMRAQIPTAPDSVFEPFVRNLLRFELINAAADSAKITVDSAQVAEIRRSFSAIVANAWAGLRIAPAMVADSAKTADERRRLIPARIDSYFDRLVKGEEQFVEVPGQLAQALRNKYDWKVNSAGLDRAVAAAQAIRAKEDSARAAAMPKSAVPMPGAPDTGKQ